MPDDGITVLVPLSKRNFDGTFALIDVEDAERVLAHNWSKHSQGYAYRMVGRQCILLHRFVLGLPVARTPLVDHINRDRRDCRKANLRVATDTQNHGNTVMRRDNTSGFRGVSFRRDTGMWAAQSAEGRKHISLGCYCTPEEAALAYDAFALQRYGEFAQLNFPSRLPEP